MNPAKKIGKILKNNGLTLSAAESCTGGLLGHMLTNIPGSSKWFKGGIIAYTNEAKMKLLGVKTATLKKYGAVSMETAKKMAEGIRKRLRTDMGISVTGIAGPTGGTRAAPVGTAFVGVADAKKTSVKRFKFNGARISIKKKAAMGALKVFLNKL